MRFMISDRNVKLQIQAMKTSFLRRVAGLSLRSRVRSSIIQEHLTRIATGLLLGEVFRDVPLGGDARADQGHVEATSFGWPGKILCTPRQAQGGD